jgi:hypothetical protein
MIIAREEYKKLRDLTDDALQRAAFWQKEKERLAGLWIEEKRRADMLTQKGEDFSLCWNRLVTMTFVCWCFVITQMVLTALAIIALVHHG